MIKRLSLKWVLVTLLLLLAAGGLVAAGRLSAQMIHAQAAPSATLAYFVCTPVEAGVFINRVHVSCTTAVSIGGKNIWWWAYPTSDSAGASRFLSLFETAKATGATVTLSYDPSDLSGATFSCNNSDCRRISGATTP